MRRPASNAARLRHPASPPRTARSLAHSTLAVIALASCAPAFAQVIPAGKGFWDTLINLLYGWPGLLIGLLFFLAAVYLWVKEGALPAVMTGLAGVILFFSPAVAQYLQQQGSASAQNIAPVKQ